MQVQSATDPPKKLALGERAIMADGGEYVALQLKEGGDPIEIVYPTEGTPLIIGPNAVFKTAPNPNAARLLQSHMFSVEGQQVMIESAGMHSVHALAKEKPGRTPLSQIKLMKDDAAAVEAESENLKKRYSQIFKV
jgi:iron(III) transport system substrate-binding protein